VTVTGSQTSFYLLTRAGAPDDAPEVSSIEIPVFQRDYAQGRTTGTAGRIRADFLDALHGAVTGGEDTAIGLDFVYGSVEGGTLRPLDGQQRLTTLFLLHWYVASRAGRLDDDGAWKQFSYATRQSARMFCESLRQHALPGGEAPTSWITDQPWYMFLWRHDPTIQSMLVVLDAIHERFDGVEPQGAWDRLTDRDEPAIWFLFLALADLRSDGGADVRAEELYIKMNSRGKPLTEFENFKARFQQVIAWSEAAGRLAAKIDTTWSDLLWHLRGDDDLVDDEFLRYLEFLIEVCEWRDGCADGAGRPLIDRARAVFGGDHPDRVTHLTFVERAFDVWTTRPIRDTFHALFTGPTDPTDPVKVKLFFRRAGSADVPLDLFEACCRSYGEMSGRVRVFSLSQTLVLYAVLLHVLDDTPDFARRLRVLRNLVEASANELRLDRMPSILDDVYQVIRHGAVDAVKTLNQAQAEDEVSKEAFLAANPDLVTEAFRLEDHELLRGGLPAFELDRRTFAAHAATFRDLMARPERWTELLAALLATGEYQRLRTNTNKFLFGTNSKIHEGAWRDLLTGPSRAALRPTRSILAELFRRVGDASSDESVTEAFAAVTDEYLARCEDQRRLDWRYYMVKYPSMREMGSSTYVSEQFDETSAHEMGYSLCMLKAGFVSLQGYFRDPYLLAIWRLLREDAEIEEPWFTGNERVPRRLTLTRSGASLRCVHRGFELAAPPESMVAESQRFDELLAQLGVVDGNLVEIPQADAIDSVDRIQRGRDIVTTMLSAGL
jgi:hypothetical protein